MHPLVASPGAPIWDPNLRLLGCREGGSSHSSDKGCLWEWVRAQVLSPTGVSGQHHLTTPRDGPCCPPILEAAAGCWPLATTVPRETEATSFTGEFLCNFGIFPYIYSFGMFLCNFGLTREASQAGPCPWHHSLPGKPQ